MKTKIFSIAFLVCTCLFTKPVLATDEAGQAGFTISPYFQNIDVRENDKNVPFSVDVTNTTSAPAILRLSILDFGTLDESGGVAFLGSSSNLKYGLASWVSLPNDTLVLEPGQTQNIKGTIENKESLSPGGHYGALFFKIEDNSDQAKAGKERVDFNPSFASLFFVRKIGGETYGLNLNSSTFAHNIFSLSNAVNLRFQNIGNTHIAPRGIVSIRDPFGRLVAKGIINDASALILPETFRVYPVTFLKLMTAVIPGRYTLDIDYRYDGKDDFSSESLTFFFVPPAIVLGLFILVLGIILYRRFIYKKNGTDRK